MIRRAIEINDNLADAFPNVPSFESEQIRFLAELAMVLATAGHGRRGYPLLPGGEKLVLVCFGHSAHQGHVA